MTVSQDILKSGPYNTDGTTKAFAATFQYLEDSDIVVTLLNTTTGATTVGVLNTDYTVVDNVSPIIGGTVTIANNGFGGIANASGVIAAGYTLTLNPAIPILQEESYPNAGLFPSAAVEQALDRLTLICQGLQLATTESLKYPVTDSATISNVLPNSTLRANLLLGFDSLGNPIATAGTGSVTISTPMVPIVQATSTMIAAELLLNGNIASLVKAVTDTNVFSQLTASVNSYAQSIWQNTSNGATASTDLTINNNLGTATTFYGNFGMNSSGFTGSGAFNKASAVYLTATSGDLAIGTTTANAIHFVYNGSATDSMFIDSTGVNVAAAPTIGTNVANKTYVDGSIAAVPFRSYVNKFRNGTMEIWQRGTSGTVASNNNATTADGWKVFTAGSTCAWAQVGPITLPSGGVALNALRLTGSAGLTDVLMLQLIESYMAAELAAQQCTFQAVITNNTGATITPTLTTRYPTSQDNWGSPTNDISVNLQSIPNGTTACVAYTFPVNTNASKGYDVLLDMGAGTLNNTNNFSITALDLRPTPGVATGLNSSPPTPELRPIGIELALCQRYFTKSYTQNVVPGTAFVAGNGSQLYGTTGGSAGVTKGSVWFKQTMRTAPTIVTYDAAGTAGDVTYYNGSTYVNAATIAAQGYDSGFSWGFAGSGFIVNFEYTASAEI